MTLTSELKAFRGCMFERITPAEAAGVEQAEQQIAAADYGQDAPRVGDLVPDFSLTDQHGTTVNLYDALRDGPVILSFYRGAWCPFCMITLRALQRQWAAARRIPATILAISPQDRVSAQATAETHGITFSVLSDPKGVVGNQWSLMYELPEPMRPLYERLGHSLPKLNGCGTWAVPLTAGYVIGPDRRVALAHLDKRIHVRMEPAEAIKVARDVSVHQPAT